MSAQCIATKLLKDLPPPLLNRSSTRIYGCFQGSFIRLDHVVKKHRECSSSWIADREESGLQCLGEATILIREAKPVHEDDVYKYRSCKAATPSCCLKGMACSLKSIDF